MFEILDQRTDQKQVSPARDIACTEALMAADEILLADSLLI